MLLPSTKNFQRELLRVHLPENKYVDPSWKGKLHLLHTRKEVVREYYTESSKWELYYF